MSRFQLVSTLALFALPAMAQITKKEVVNPATPAEDAKGLSDSVPNALALSTKLERIVIVRLKNQADLLAGLEQQVRDQRIRNAVILGGMGSVISTHYHVVSNRSFPSKNLFVEDPQASADIVNVNGFVLNGRIHAHIIFSGADKAFGGHLEPRTRVFTFAVIALGILPDAIDIRRFDDKSWR